MPSQSLGLKGSTFSLLDTASYSPDKIKDLFATATAFEKRSKVAGYFQAPTPLVLGFLFFEPSTRTRMSFQMAAHRLGYGVLDLDNAMSSLSKGETYEDTVLNLVAMGPDALVVRYGHSKELDAVLPTLSIPVVNAGSGTSAHPTQALLDAFTISKNKGSVEGRRVLIVGDIRHSRVARSNFDVLQKLGAEIAVCGPAEFIPQNDLPPFVKTFDVLDEAIQWCDVYMGLRIQLERHMDCGLPADKAREQAAKTYHERFGLTRERLQILKKDAIIMHPGPINHGVEFSSDASVMSDPRNRVLEQVSNGVLIRAALLTQMLGHRTHAKVGE